VSGHSAGGHLTASMMSLGAFKGGLAISGLYDLESIRFNYLNVKLVSTPPRHAATARYCILLSKPGPLVISYGTAGPNCAGNRWITPRLVSGARCRPPAADRRANHFTIRAQSTETQFLRLRNAF
jgi:hypothetical protein